MSLWDIFSRKDPKDLFLAYSPQATTWRVVSWNFDLKNKNERQWAIEAHGTSPEVIRWEKQSHETLKFFKNQKLLRMRRIPTSDKSLKWMMNLAIHSTLKYGLEENHEHILSPVSGATTLDFQNENRALQWLQASLGTLYRALDRFRENDELILTAAVFSGLEPETQERVFRVIVFNLDIFYYMRNDSTLQIVVFNDKDKGSGETKSPSFQQIIKVTKPQFYDEIIKLVHRIAMEGEIN